MLNLLPVLLRDTILTHVKELALKIGCLLIATLIGALVAEGFLRLFHPVDFRLPPSSFQNDTLRQLSHQRSSVPGLAYELVPGISAEFNGAPARINSQGMRGNEPLSEEEGPVIRIALLGDSYTFGYGVRDEETLDSLLENKLRSNFSSQGHRIDVLNFSVAGYAMKDQASVLQYKVLDWNPRLIVIGYYLNDPELEPIQPLHSYFAETRWWQYSHLTRAISLIRYNLQKFWYGKGDYFLALHQHPEKWKSVEQAFSTISRLTRERQIPVFLMLIPDLKVIHLNPYPYRDIHLQVKTAAEKNGFHFLDLYSQFVSRKIEEVAISRVDSHFNALGNRLAAEFLLQELIQIPGLFPESNTP